MPLGFICAGNAHHVCSSHILLLLQIWPPPQLLPHAPQLVVVVSGTHWFVQQPFPAAQHWPPQTVSPLPHSRHEVPLQTPVAQLVTAGVGHWPLALHTAAAVTLPALHV
jgi:hypothetical protein